MAESRSLPVVDLTATREGVIQDLYNACHDIGFFYLTGHGLEEAQGEAFAALERFFALPYEEKVKVRVTKDHRGFTPAAREEYKEDVYRSLPREKRSEKESFFVGRLDIKADGEEAKNVPLQGPNVWPSEEVLARAAFRDPIERYFTSVRELGMRVQGLIVSS